MKVIKIILALPGIVVITALVALLYLLSNFNTVIKDTVESLGPKVTKTDVKLDAVDVSLMESRVVLNGLSIGNPAGFNKNTPLLAMGEVILHIDPKTLADRVKVVKEITVSGIEIVAEHKNIRDTNIEKLVDNIKHSSNTVRQKAGRGETDQYVSQQQTALQQEAAQKTGDTEVRLMIEKLTFAASSVKLVTAEWGDHSVELPEFSKTDLGDRVEGLTPKQVVSEILSAYMAQTRESVRDKIKELGKSKLEKKFEKYKEKYKESIFKKMGIGG